MSSTRRQVPVTTATVLIAAALLALAAAGGATAGALVTGAQIKDGTVTSKDVKDRSLKLKDVKPSEVAKLKGADGEDGDDGAPGFGPPPAGTLVTGGGVLRTFAPAGDTPEEYNPFPFTLAAPLDDDGPGRNIFFAPSGIANDGEESVACTGNSAAPSAPAGTLCIYFTSGTLNLTANSARAYAGNGSVTEASDRSGFLLFATAPAAAVTQARYVWAYQAP